MQLRLITLAFIATSFDTSVTAIQLRKLSPDPAAPAPASASMANSTLDRGERGHFYYAEKCEDCFYKAPHCGCKPVVEYFACLTKFCHSSKDDMFTQKCIVLSNQCGTELDIDCEGRRTDCHGKFGQLASGGLGLSVKVDSNDAFCGPWGKCVGKIVMNVEIHNAPQGPSPSPATAPSAIPPPINFVLSGSNPATPPALLPPNVQVVNAALPPAAAPAPAPAVASSMFVECGLPKVDHAKIDKVDDWNLCRVQPIGNKAICEIPIQDLEIGDKMKSYCVLTDGIHGKRLTQPHWTRLTNHHKKDDQEDEKGDIVGDLDLDVGSEEAGKLPWMVEKEKRVAARKAEKEEKEDEAGDNGKEKQSATDGEKATEGVKKGKEEQGAAENESGLPWMEGKKQPPRPEQEHAWA